MSPKKALLLGTILLVPVVAFLFLKVFGVNRFALQTYFPVRVDSTMVEGQWRYDTIFHQVPPFSLTSQTGQTVSSASLSDKIYLANFFNVSCQGPCKQITTQLSRVQDAFRFQPDVLILSFSLKPDQDSVAALRKFADSFGLDDAKWVLLTGSPTTISALLQGGFPWPQEGTGKLNEIQSINDRLWLVDKEGHIRGVYDGSKALEIDKLMTETNVLLSEYKMIHGKPNQ